MSDIILYILIGILTAIFIGCPIYLFFTSPSEKQKEALREWLKWAVTKAEKELGSGTGQIKLREVYNMALQQFPWLTKVVPFDIFCLYVDEALDWMRDQINKNKSIESFVKE